MKGVCSAVVAALIVLFAPTAAAADTPPAFTERPAVAGAPRESEELTATASWTGDPAPTVAWQWLRCEVTRSSRCQPIAEATSSTYRIAAADVGSRLRVRVELENTAGLADARSDATAVVEPVPETEPEPEPGASAPPQATFEAPPNPIVDPAPAPSGEERPPLLDPFPIVRIRGWLTRTGARVTLLTVRAPRGARIAARCQGRSCPVRRLARTASLIRLRALQRHLRAGTRLDITVSKAGYVGKWTTIVIRAGRPPSRSDRCVLPGARRPTPCPAG